MEEVIYQADLDKAATLLKNCLTKQAPSDALMWLENKQKQISAEKTDALYFMTFSAIATYFSKELLDLKNDELRQADSIRKQWRLNNWSIAQTARTYLILSFARHHIDRFKEAMDKIFSAADLHELIALYQALPVFPFPEKFHLHATNGIRSNMISVFEAIALNNPYPADYFDDLAWNQLVLKALFVDSPLEQVIGLKRRANPALARALINTARERYAASRPIRPELWFLIGLSTDKEVWPLLKNLSEEEGHAILQQGALLACDYCQLPEAKKLLERHMEKKKDIQEDLQKLRSFEQQLM